MSPVPIGPTGGTLECQIRRLGFVVFQVTMCQPSLEGQKHLGLWISAHIGLWETIKMSSGRGECATGADSGEDGKD